MLFLFAEAQTSDPETASFLERLETFPLSPDLSIFCDTDPSNPRPFVPASLRFQIFQCIYNLAYPSLVRNHRSSSSSPATSGLD